MLGFLPSKPQRNVHANVGLEVKYLVWAFINNHTLCVQEV